LNYTRKLMSCQKLVRCFQLFYDNTFQHFLQAKIFHVSLFVKFYLFTYIFHLFFGKIHQSFRDIFQKGFAFLQKADIIIFI